MNDFEDLYQNGDIIQFEREGIIKMEILKLKVMKVYPYTIIATENRGMSYCIDWQNRDKILLLSRGDE